MRTRFSAEVYPLQTCADDSTSATVLGSRSFARFGINPPHHSPIELARSVHVRTTCERLARRALSPQASARSVLGSRIKGKKVVLPTAPIQLRASSSPFEPTGRSGPASVILTSTRAIVPSLSAVSRIRESTRRHFPFHRYSRLEGSRNLSRNQSVVSAIELTIVHAR